MSRINSIKIMASTLRTIPRMAPILAVFAVLPLLAFGPADRAEATRWAFIVGVTDYIHFDDVEGGDLPGAERDARAMRDVLVGRWGFPEENVRMLLNRDATRAAIEEGLTQWLPENVSAGDQVVFYFAGHGSQIWDENGDEDDGLDETIAPTDVDPLDPKNDIVDEELGAWLRALPTNNVWYVHDNCNAGTGTRSVTPFSQARRLARDPANLPGATSTGRRALPGQDEDMSGFDMSDVDILELAASQPNQAAVDAFFAGEDGSEPFYGGAFTTYLVQQLWRAPEGESYADIFEGVREAMKQARFQQDPYLSTDSDLANFPAFFLEGAAGTGAIAGLPILSGGGNIVELGAGLAVGLSQGTVLETESGARMRVTSATRDRATAETLNGMIETGDRARMVGYPFPEPSLRLNVGAVDSETVGSLTTALSDVNGVVLVEDEDEFAHLLLQRRGTEIRVLGQDGFERHRVEAGAAGSAELARVLRREAASMRLSEVDNPGQAFEVEIAITDGRQSFGLGELVSFTARSEREGYLTLVDLGTDGTVTVLFPNPFESDNRIQAGRAFTFPTAAMDFEIPAQPPIGRGMVRAFVTEQPLELPAAGEEWVSGDVLLAEVIAQALFAAAGETAGAVALGGWGTSALVYDITR